MNRVVTAVGRLPLAVGLAAGLAVGLAALLAAGPMAFPGAARAATVMVIEDFAPMRMVPSARAPRKDYAPLGLLLETRRTAKDGQMFEATNGEEHPFESPGWLHYWMFPASVLAEPGRTRVSLDLLLLDGGGAAADSSRVPAPFPGRRYSVADFLADSASIPGAYHVAAGDPNDRSPWGGRAVIPPPWDAPYRLEGPEARLEALRAATSYRLAVTLSAEKVIAHVRERIAAARVLVREPRCREWEYVETEVLTVTERKRTIGDRGGTALVAIPATDLTTTSSAAGVLWTRLVYVADVFFEDGTSETVARRLIVTWPLCPEEER